MRRTNLLAAIVFLSAEIAAAAPVGRVTFYAKGSGLALDIESSGGVLDGDIAKTGDLVGGKFSTKLDAYETGISLRDSHMRKALETDKYPLATLALKPVKLSAADTPFTGDLTLHGVTKPVSGTARLSGKDVVAKFIVKLTDFGIKPPEYKVAKVKNEVDVKVELTL